MSRFNRASSVVQQEKEKIILISGSSNLYRTRMGLVRFNNEMKYDPTFDTMDPTTKVAFTPGAGAVNDVAIDTSLNVYVGGSFTSYRGLTNNRIMKLLPTGAKDTSFDNTTGFNNTVNKLFLDNNNKLYSFGSFTTYKGVTENRIIRLNSDGSKDVGFDNSTGFNTGTVNDIAVDSLGKIYCVGTFTTYKGNTCNGIVRINTDGSFDNTFVIGSGFNSSPSAIYIDSFDKIFVGGNFSTYSGISANSIVKLNNDGSIDTSFNYGTGFLPTAQIFKLMCDEIGNVYVSVNNNNSVYKNTTTPYGLWKIDASGNFVSSLNTPSNVSGTPPLYVINSENIIYTKENSLRLLTSIGSIKKTLMVTSPLITGIKLDLSGNTYLHGTIINNGIFDRNFDLGIPLGEDGLIKPEKFNQNRGRTSNNVGPLRIKNLTKDNKLIFIPCDTYNGVPKKDILKLTLNGSLDNEFDTGTGFQFLNSYAEDTDTLGNIYIITNSPNYKGETFTLNPGNGVLIKIKNNGDRDTSFIPVVISTNFYDTTHIYVQQDNKVILIYNQGAQFNLSGQTYNGIIRFNTNGSVDNTFSGGTWAHPGGSIPGISKLFLHTDGKLYLRTSNFPNLTYNGVSVGEFVRLNNDGSLDNTFVTNAVNTFVEGLLVDKYNKVWIWGDFTSYSGITNNRILRLNNDGTIDNTFDNAIGFNGTVNVLNYDNDTDKVYCTGGFTTYKGLSYRYLISLNYNGTINTSFNVSPNNSFSSTNTQSISIVKI